ncbi:MAG: DUF3419 family protein [Polyangiales bacterium]
MTRAAAVTVWERGRLDARARPGEVLFGRMYEDSSIERAAFRPGSRVFCIASAGCTAMALAPDHDVVAVDINPKQLAYAKQRFEGEPGMRGKAERVMAFARFFGPLAGWWPTKVAAFLELDDPDTQMAYWQQELDTWRFRRAIDLLFSVTALGTVYASPLLAVLPRHFGAVVRARMERCFARHPNRDNPYARALLLGEGSSAPSPPKAREIRLVHADAADFLENEPAGSFDAFTLSNILDGTDDAYAERLRAAVRHAAALDAVAVLRSFGVADAGSSDDHAAEDRSMLWGSVLVRGASAL